MQEGGTAWGNCKQNTLSQTSSGHFWKLAGTGTLSYMSIQSILTAAQRGTYCMPGEHAGPASTGIAYLQDPGTVHILAKHGCATWGGDDMTKDVRILSSSHCAFTLPSIKYTDTRCHNLLPLTYSVISQWHRYHRTALLHNAHTWFLNASKAYLCNNHAV